MIANNVHTTNTANVTAAGVVEGPIESKIVHGARLMHEVLTVHERAAGQSGKTVAETLLELYGKELFDDVFHTGLKWNRTTINYLVKVGGDRFPEGWDEMDDYDITSYMLHPGEDAPSKRNPLAYGALWVASYYVIGLKETAGSVIDRLLGIDNHGTGDSSYFPFYSIDGDRYTTYLLNKYVANRPNMSDWENAKANIVYDDDGYGDFSIRDYQQRLGWTAEDGKRVFAAAGESAEGDPAAGPPEEAVVVAAAPVQVVPPPKEKEKKKKFGFKVDILPAKKLEPGARCGAMCIHAVGGTTGREATENRKKRVLVDHATSLALSGDMHVVQCEHHVRNWKKAKAGVLLCVKHA